MEAVGEVEEQRQGYYCYNRDQQDVHGPLPLARPWPGLSDSEQPPPPERRSRLLDQSRQ
jgi:hypothetical protein